MKELIIIERNPNAADPYSGENERLYASPYEVHDRLIEIANEEENSFYDVLPDEVVEKIYEDEYFQEDLNQNKFFYYKDRASTLLESFDDYEYDLKLMDLTLYQTDRGANFGIDTASVIEMALFYDDIAKLLSFKSIFCKHIFEDDKNYKKEYKAFAEELYEVLHDYDSKINYYSVEHEILKLYQNYFNSGETLGFSGVMRVKQGVNNLFHAVADKADKLDLRLYTSTFIQSRELCLNFDRYIREIQASVVLHEELKRYYKLKETALKLEYEKK